MGLLAGNGATIKMILKFLGIRDLQASTEHPDAEIRLDFVQYGVKHSKTFTLGEFVDGVTAASPQDTAGPPDGFIDVADLPDAG